jgi:thiol-disulfide isomerase/thioredoxin
MPSRGKPLLNYELEDSSGMVHDILEPSSKLNMVIFWASWCSPCKREIPELKKVYAELKNKDINMVSVSIDNDSKMWRLALKKEKMDWRQLLVDSSLMEKVKSTFNFSVIPLIIFTDDKGIEINRLTGYDASNIDQIKNIIEKYLSLDN